MKIVYKILPLILIFVMLFSFTVSAEETTETPLYICTYDDWYAVLISATIEQYYTDVGSEDEIFVYARTAAVDSDAIHRLDIWIAPRSSAPGPGTSPTIMSYAGGIRRYYSYGATWGDVGAVSYQSTVDSIELSTNAVVKYQMVYVSQDIYNDSGVLYYESPAPLYSDEEEEEPKNDFLFNLLEEFEDYQEKNDAFNDAAQSEAVTENENNPNDSVFQNIFQSMCGLLHTNNSINQQISNQLQNFSDNFFNNFAQYSLGLMQNILGALNSFSDKFNNLLSIANQLYESGLDSNGNFGIGTMLNYWFVPDVEEIHQSFNDTIGQVDAFNVVTDTALGFLSSLQTVEPVAPMFTIPAGHFSYSPSSDITVAYDLPEYKISFSWFEDWKPYTDPIIAAFIYGVFIWHLFKQIPGILSGAAATTATADYYNNAAIKDLNKKAKGG